LKIHTSRLGLLLLSLPLALGTISLSAEANPTSSSTVASTETKTTIPQVSSETQLKAIATDPIAQNVTSVSQLSDVRPTDWAFTALQSLVERYGCIAGYPDSTFRGKQATSRYEFAAGLNSNSKFKK
jgi:hypothetical protein